MNLERAGEMAGHPSACTRKQLIAFDTSPIVPFLTKTTDSQRRFEALFILGPIWS